MNLVTDLIRRVQQLVEHAKPLADGYRKVAKPDWEYLEFLCRKRDAEFPISGSARSAYGEQMRGGAR